jgi:beta-glucanase (GH16 family)
MRVVALGASLLTIAALATGALAAAHAADSGRPTVVVAMPVSGPGLYAVTIVVTARSEALNRVTVTVGTVTRTAQTSRRHLSARIEVRVRIGGRSLMVRAVGRFARPLLSVRARLLEPAAAKRPHPHAAHTPPSAQAQTQTTTTTTAAPAPPPAPAPTPTPAPAPPQPPGPGSPFTNLVWSDDFIADWQHAGGSGASQQQLPSTWALDNWGGCGTSPPQLSQNTGQAGSAYLTSQGLVLPVVSTGPSSYRAAQVDTHNIAGESWQYGTIEASLTLPTGQGLCPAFWMLPNNGVGEIDILEAPSFVNPIFGPLAPYAVFTLHANNTQQFEAAATPPGWNPGQPNVYGLIWTPTSITWTVNFTPYAGATPALLANPAMWSAFTSGAFHLLFDVAVGGWPGDPPAGTVFTAPMTVQWVKVFH